MTARHSLSIALRHHRKGRLYEADSIYRELLESDPDDPEVLQLTGALRLQLGDYDQAIALLQRALDRDPGRHAPRHNLVRALWMSGDYAQAEALLDQLIADAPEDAALHRSLAEVRRARGRYQDALEAETRALALDPENAGGHWRRGLLLLLLGRYGEGWPEYVWRFKAAQGAARPDEYRAMEWDGAPLEGRPIFIHTEPGVGETIQFVRFLDTVAERGGRILFGCQPETEPLLRFHPAIETIVLPGEASPPFAVQAPLAALGKILNIGVEDLPAAPIPYLRLDPTRVERWRQRLGDERGCKLGLVWRGNPGNADLHTRHCPLARLAPLLSLEGVRVFSLQKEVPEEDQPLPEGMVDLGPELTDFAETAAVMSCLDLIVTVDTAAAHLAGALGLETWLMLSDNPGWTWMTERADSPWYPSLRLFRQDRNGDWDPVVRALADALQDRSAVRSETHKEKTP